MSAQQKQQKNKKSLINFRVTRDNFMGPGNDGSMNMANPPGVVASQAGIGFPVQPQMQQMSQLSLQNTQPTGIIAASGTANLSSSQNFSSNKARTNSYKANQQSHMQQSHPNLVTFNQIENYNSQGVTAGSQSQSKRVIQNTGRISGSNQLSNDSNTRYPAPPGVASQQPSSRFKHINERLKKSNRNANRRIHISFDNTAGGEDHVVPNTGGTAPLGFMGQGNASGQGPPQPQMMNQIQNQNQGTAANRITSTERHQNNNVSSSNPKKAIVTPRQNHHMKFKQNPNPHINTGPDMINAISGEQQNNLYQKNLSHQINTQRNNYQNHQMIYGAGTTGSQFTVKHATSSGNHNLPLIRTESHDSKLKDTQKFGALAQNSNIRQSHNFKNSVSQGANGANAQMQGNSTQNLRMNFQSTGVASGLSGSNFGNNNHVNSAMLIQNNQNASQQVPPSSAQKLMFKKSNKNNQTHIFNKNKQQMAQKAGVGSITNQSNGQMSGSGGVQSQQNLYNKNNNQAAIQSNDFNTAPGSGMGQQQLKVAPPKTQGSHRRAQNQGSNQKQHNSGMNSGMDHSNKNFFSQQNDDSASGNLLNLNPSGRQMVQRINSVIPEAPERDELTANDLSKQKIEYPINPAFAKQKIIADKYLTDFEKTEVDEFDQIYYMCENKDKIKATKLERLVNNGFDDEEGYYRIQKGDHISYRFQLIEVIGKGAFGQVIKCLDHKHNELVAIKLVKNQKKYYYQAAVEAKLLLLLKESDPDNVERVVKLRDYFVFRNHLCCVFDLYSINLYEFIKMYNYQGFEYGLIRRFAIQLLSALRYMKYLGIVHCDLKPENILLKRKDKSGIVVADFGSGCLENEIVYTYIQSRFYRAPDIILGLFPYTQQIDMWSFGCIMIELYTGFPLFPGTNEREQLQLIIDVIGMPSQQVLKNSQRKQLFSQFKDNAVPAPLEVLTDDQKEERLKYIMQKLREAPDDSFVNFIGRCLEWDPKKRLTPDEGLQHEWIIKGLPPNIILHNPHNNPYQRGNHNSSSSTQNANLKHFKSTNASSQSKHQQMKRQQSARRPVPQSIDGSDSKQSSGAGAPGQPETTGSSKNQHNQGDNSVRSNAYNNNGQLSSSQFTNDENNSSRQSGQNQSNNMSSHRSTNRQRGQPGAKPQQLDSRSIDKKGSHSFAVGNTHSLNNSLNSTTQSGNAGVAQAAVEQMNSSKGYQNSQTSGNSNRSNRQSSRQPQPSNQAELLSSKMNPAGRLGQNHISKRNNMIISSNLDSQ